MTCGEVTDFLIDYLAGDLPQEQRMALDVHLAVCPDCRRYLDSYRKTVALTKTSAQAGTPLSEAIPESLVAAILRAKRGSTKD